MMVKKLNTRRVILIGVSMGGTLVLDVLSLANPDLKNLISDVLAVFPITDYEYTISHSKRENILNPLHKHFSKYKNPFEVMRTSSPVTYISGVPDSTKIVLVESLKDTHVPHEQIEDYYNRLKSENKNIALYKFNSDHDISGVRFRKLAFTLLKPQTILSKAALN